MDGKTYKLGFKGSQETVKLQKYTILALSATILLLTYGVLQKRERLVIIPPVIEERMELGYESANQHYYKSWALYVASFLGNINPSNAGFVSEGLSLSFSAELYQEMRAKIVEDAEKMRVTGRSLRFYADKVVYEEDTKKTFVAGKQEVVSAAGNVHEQDVCYEFEVDIKEGLPTIAKFAYYPGAPRTQDWLQRNRHTQVAATE